MNSAGYGVRLIMAIIACVFILRSFMNIKDNYKEYKDASKIQKFILHMFISIDMTLIFFMILILINIGIEVLNKQ
jgi:hypothetical protein